MSGFVMSVLMIWLAGFSYAQDNQHKHGISHQQASRLGGLSILVGAVVLYNVSIHSDANQLFDRNLGFTSFFWLITSCSIVMGAIGFWDDYRNNISPMFRLVLCAAAFSAVFLLEPDVMPSKVGVWGVDYLLSIPVISFALCLLAALAMLNAINIADGANGLIPFILMGALLGFYQLTGEPLIYSVVMACLVFFIFNVFSGKLFLGDNGTYGLGAFVILTVMHILNRTEADIWFVFCLMSYPVIEFVNSIVRRIFKGVSPTKPDNDHLHNLLFAQIRTKIKNVTLANSLSGMIISVPSTGLAIYYLEVWGIHNLNWPWLFLGQVIAYYVFWGFIHLCSNIQTPTR